MAESIAGFFARADVPLPIVASVFTPYQLMFLERVCALIEPRPTLIVDARPDRFRDGRPPAVAGAEVLSLQLTGAVTDAGQASLVHQGVAAAELFAREGPFLFACASYQWPINNVFYTRHRRDPKCRFLLLDDGLSTYLDVKPSLRERARNVAREIVARARGFPPRSFLPGHPLGHDIPEVEAVLIGTRDAPPGAGRRRYVPLPESGERIEFTPDAALFVGQHYGLFYEPEVLDPVIDQIAANLKARGFKRLGFKPHHYQKRDEIARYLALGFELVDPPMPLEEMIARSEFRTIASINSSALLTSRSLFGDGVHAIAFNPTAFKPPQEQRDMREVKDIFSLAGVEVVTLPPPNSRDPR